MLNRIQEMKNSFSDSKTTVQLTLDDYIKKVGRRFGLTEARAFINLLYQVNPGAAISLLSREIAIDLDLKYPDHISEAQELYVISLTDGRIHKIYPAQIRSYKAAAFFRNIEDAKFACRLLSDLLSNIFNASKSKN